MSATRPEPTRSISQSSGSIVRLFGLDPASYRHHRLHEPDRSYVETDCYTDIWIELLHARGNEPLAAMGVTMGVDFEGDQWTFFKPLPDELELLYGIDVHEMQPYRPLPLQLVEQISAGRTLMIEVDAWYLPDVHGTSYRSEHVKTTIGVEMIDAAAERIYYFHSTGLHELSGDDYRGVFRLGGDLPPELLPPYVELVRFDAGSALAGDELREAAHSLLRRHLAARPARNPFLAFGAQLELQLPRLLEGDLADFHAYAFTTVRMLGAAFELGAAHTSWLLGERGQPAADALDRIVEGSKALSFKLARQRPFDPSALIDELATNWDEAMTRLVALVG
jgi:hypothetical protein